MGVAGSNRRGGGAGSSPAAGSFRVTIPSDFAAGRDVQERIMADVIRHGFGTDTTFAIRIALEEAMVNAIKHGNRLDPAKKVRVECKVTSRRAEMDRRFPGLIDALMAAYGRQSGKPAGSRKRGKRARA